MARRSRMSILKRQRELKKAEKAAHKRAKRHGIPIMEMAEPRATVPADAFVASDDEDPDSGPDQPEDSESEPTEKSDPD